VLSPDGRRLDAEALAAELDDEQAYKETVLVFDDESGSGGAPSVSTAPAPDERVIEAVGGIPETGRLTPVWPGGRLSARPGVSPILRGAR
jgi:hypothetical protein